MPILKQVAPKPARMPKPASTTPGSTSQPPFVRVNAHTEANCPKPVLRIEACLHIRTYELNIMVGS
ncbi:hypothetical protein VE02_09597, partial [Pseudogymnoascus sp. 03VT05]